MSDMPNFEKANNHNYLWPSIGDAVDTYLRRRACGAGSYERVWRLIHLWEAMIITLGGAVLARYSVWDASDPVLRRCREHFYGRSWDIMSREFSSSMGAAHGSIDQWIAILFEVAKDEQSRSPFVAALRRFLNQKAIDLSQLVKAWNQACDVPADAQRGPFQVKQAMRHINTFRNRFAHVPFPHDPLDDLARAFEDATEQLFSLHPEPWRCTNSPESSPLTGAWRYGRNILRGNMPFLTDNSTGQELRFSFPVVTSSKGEHEPEEWSASAFAYIDSMLRPHVLTRFDEGEETGEYTRFRAEANAIVLRYGTDLGNRLPAPARVEYQDEAEDDKQEAAIEDMTYSDAIEAMRNGEDDKVIAFFSEMTRSKPDYHIAWLRLGHARKEKGVRLPDDAREETKALLEEAVHDLGEAAGHRDSSYQAKAIYERSKAHYHLALRNHEILANLRRAIDDARQAYQISSESRYESWIDHLEEYIERTHPGLLEAAGAGAKS